MSVQPPLGAGGQPPIDPDSKHKIEANMLLTTNDEVKEFASIFYTGQLLCLYSSHVLRGILEGRDKDSKTLKAILGNMHVQAARGTPLNHLHNLLAGHVMPVLKREVSSAKRRHNQDTKTDTGTVLPFPYLNTQMGGSLKPGQILVLYGDDAAVDESLELICDALTSTESSFAHLVSRRVRETGLVSLAWWEGCCKNNSDLKNAFKPLADKTAIVVDDMDLFVKGTPHDRLGKLNKIAKRLMRIIPKTHQSIIIGLRSEYGEEIPTARMDSIHVAYVEQGNAPDGGKVLTVAGEDIAHRGGPNGGSDQDVSGSRDSAAEGLEDIHVRAEDGKLEGSGEETS